MDLKKPKLLMSLSSSPNFGRTDEPEKGTFVIANTIDILDQYLIGTARKPFNRPRGNFILFISNDNVTDLNVFNLKCTKIMKKLWSDYGIINVVLMSSCVSAAPANDLIYYFDPFEKCMNYSMTKINDDGDDGDNMHNNNWNENEMTAEEWGVLKWIKMENFNLTRYHLLRKTSHLKGYPLKVNIFERNPSIMRSENFPKTLLKSYYANVLNETNGYMGVDAITLGNIVKVLNFKAIIKIPSDNDYGYKLDNGTFIGK